MFILYTPPLIYSVVPKLKHDKPTPVVHTVMVVCIYCLKNIKFMFWKEFRNRFIFLFALSPLVTKYQAISTILS